MDFFTSDPHLNHKRSIETDHCNRPFNSVEQMNTTIINNWNNKINNNDTVYILGDLAFGNYNQVLDAINSLNGRKILLLGDHDKQIKKDMSEFIKIDNYIFYKNKDIRIALFHWCIRTWQKSHFNSFHLFGHSHGRLNPIGKSWDIGVDNNNFTPLSLDEIIDIMKNRPDNPNLIRTKNGY